MQRKDSRRASGLRGPYVVRVDRVPGAVEVNLKDTLGRIQNKPTVFARFEVLPKRFHSLGGKGTFQVVANCADGCSTGHDSPQQLEFCVGKCNCAANLQRRWFSCKSLFYRG